ncbi:MAG: glycosyltransferase family 4 protein [Candidatus Velthaea sp.]
MIDVAVDARQTRRMSAGTRRYVCELLARLPQAAPDLRVHAAGRGGNFGVAEQLALPLELARLQPRAVHYPTTFAPLLRRAPYVVTIHDAIHLRYPRLFGRATALHYALLGRPLARGAAALCMGDGRTVDDCVRFFGVPEQRCRVVPLGYDPLLLTAEEPLTPRRPFFLYAGNHRAHKNLATLAAAWSALPPGLEADLVLTGPDEPALRARYARLNGELAFAGDLAPAELRRRYRAAAAYVHPALCEGFGIPMLEAAVAGTPVIASSGAVPAIVEPYAATFPATDARTLTELLEAVLRDDTPFRARAAEGAGPLRAYTWDRFAVSTAAVYREVLECM